MRKHKPAGQPLLYSKLSIILLLLLVESATQLLAEESSSSATLVATVNGQKITSGDLKLDFFTKQLSPQQGQVGQEQLIQTLIDRELVSQFLEKRNIKPDQFLLEQRMNIIRKMIEKKGDDFAEVLSKLGLNEKSLEEVVSRQIAWKTYVNSVLTETEIQELWNANKSHFDGTEVHAAQIFLKLQPQATAEEISANINKLNALKAKVSQGELSFSTAAKQFSESPSAATGGDLGTFEFYGAVATPIAEAAFTTEPGKVSDPFQSNYGVHLVQVIERTAGDLSLEDARPQVVAVLSEKLWQDLSTRLRKSANILLE